MWPGYHHIFAAADGCDSRLPVPTRVEVFLRRPGAALDGWVQRHRGEVTESTPLVALAWGYNSSPGGVGRPGTRDRNERLAGISGCEHRCSSRSDVAVGEHPIQVHSLAALRHPHRQRGIEVITAATVERPGGRHGVAARVELPVENGWKTIVVAVVDEPDERAVEIR